MSSTMIARFLLCFSLLSSLVFSSEPTPLQSAADRVAKTFLAEHGAAKDYRANLALEALLEIDSASAQTGYTDQVLALLEKRDMKPTHSVPWRSQPFGCLTYAIYRTTADKTWLPVFLEESGKARNEIHRTTDGLVTHGRGKQRGGGHAVLIDSMQEYTARMARAGALTGEPDWFVECLTQWNLHRDLLRDPKSGLWSQGRGWLKDEPDRLSPGAWSRGHGWLLRGLIDSIAHCPPESDARQRLVTIMKELFTALAPLQRDDGMWPTLLHRAADESPPDSSGTAMIATAFSRAWREGWLDEDASISAGKAFAALPAFVDEKGRVLSTSPGPGPLESEEDYLAESFPPGNDHGTFAILFAAAESIRLAKHNSTSPPWTRPRTFQP
jgi:unsaturated rhamnogalacturonyl hydrolase